MMQVNWLVIVWEFTGRRTWESLGSGSPGTCRIPAAVSPPSLYRWHICVLADHQIVAFVCVLFVKRVRVFKREQLCQENHREIMITN